MDLTSKYLGINLKNPLVPSSSPLMKSLDNIKRLEDAGAAAVVLHSLYEEQVTEEALSLHYHTTQGSDSFAESLSYFPDLGDYKFSGDEYLEHIKKIKETSNLPVIGSLNGVTSGGWLKYARLMQEAGADALELNMYYISTDPIVDGMTLINIYLDIVNTIRRDVTIPIAIKLSPFFTSLPEVCSRFVIAGANGFVLFNRFYQPDFDIEERVVRSNIVLSDSGDARLPLRWIGILYNRLNASLAATTGIHTAEDVIKMIMAGADVTMMASALLKNGIDHLAKVLNDLEVWMEKHEYTSIEEMKGSMSLKSVENPAAYERALYIKEMHSYK